MAKINDTLVIKGRVTLSNPVVTVVIPTYNRATLLPRALDSLLNQTLTNWKAIIIDDSSTDNTKKVIKEYLRKDDRITYYRMPTNKGVAHALNQGLKRVDTEFMLQLDSDDWLEEKSIETIVEEMNKQPKKIALAYGNFMICRNGEAILRKLRSFNSSEKYQFICYPHPFYPRFYRTSCLLGVGGWDTHDPYEGRYLEDRMIMFKLIEQYDFLWIDQHLYNLCRDNNERLTKERAIHNELKKELIIDTLIKWGNHYTPVFSNHNRWLRTKLIPNKY